MQQLLFVRDDEERAEARRALSFLQAMRQAIPASLDSAEDTKACYERYERELIGKANGAALPEKRARYAPSKNTTRKPARRAPQPAQK